MSGVGKTSLANEALPTGYGTTNAKEEGGVIIVVWEIGAFAVWANGRISTELHRASHYMSIWIQPVGIKFARSQGKRYYSLKSAFEESIALLEKEKLIVYVSLGCRGAIEWTCKGCQDLFGRGHCEE